jgi:alkylation response protein AidB-like acyl-CoA dehydrogenase
MDSVGNLGASRHGAFRHTVRAWLEEHLTDDYRRAARVSALTDDANFDVRLGWEKELAAGGWLGITWPADYGGRGSTLAEEMVFLEEHTRAGAPWWVGVQGRDLFGPILLQHGSDEQKRRFLPPIMAVEEFWGQGFSEPGAGSDLANISTRAVRSGAEWVVNGQKIWMSLGSHAHWIYALCRTDPTSERHRGISLLLIPVDQPGVDVRPIRHLAGGHDFCEVFLDDARTAVENVVGGAGNGWSVAMSGLGTERFTTTLAYQAQFHGQYAELVGQLQRRGATTDPVARQRLASSWIALEINRIANESLLHRLLHDKAADAETSLAKLRWATTHQTLTTDMVDLLGATELIVGHGYDLDPFQAAFLNARAESIYGGTHEVQRNIVAERLLGLPR